MNFQSLNRKLKGVVKNPVQAWNYVLVFFVVLLLALLFVDAYIFYRNTKIKSESVEVSGKQLFNRSTFEEALSILRKRQEYSEAIKVSPHNNPFKTEK